MLVLTPVTWRPNELGQSAATAARPEWGLFVQPGKRGAWLLLPLVSTLCACFDDKQNSEEKQKKKNEKKEKKEKKKR